MQTPGQSNPFAAQWPGVNRHHMGSGQVSWALAARPTEEP